MTTAAVEAFLARLYTDAEAMERFLHAPREEASRAGLGEPECEALAQADLTGMRMAARSFSLKRAGKAGAAVPRRSWGWQAVKRWFGR